MALDPITVRFTLDELFCKDEGKDPGKSAEPYLWTVFFKVDGATARLDAGARLAGTATTVATPGSHGNLGRSEVNTDDRVPIPAAIGNRSIPLEAIPVDPALQALIGLDRIPGVIGVVAVLMEHDWTSDSGAEAGHAALNRSVQAELDRIVGTIDAVELQQLQAGAPFDEVVKLDEIETVVKREVKEAIKENGRIFQDLANLLNKDDALGAEFTVFSHGDLDAGPTRTFTFRYCPAGKRGDWEIRGRVEGTVVAPPSPRPVPPEPVPPRPVPPVGPAVRGR